MKNNHLDQNQKRIGHYRSSQDTFVVPEGYFDDQKENILADSRISTVPRPYFKKYAMAASIILAVGVSAALFYFQLGSSESVTLSSGDYATYLLLENTEIDQLAFHIADHQLEYDLTHVSDESIEDYLIEQNIDINHLTINQ